MKKYILIFTIFVIITSIACGTESTTTKQTDSTNVVVDTTIVLVNSSGGGDMEKTDNKDVKSVSNEDTK